MKEAKKNNLPIHNKEGQHIYTIYLEHSFHNLPKYLEEMNLSARRVCIVTDSNTKSIYENEILNLLSPYVNYMSTFTFPAGEENKTLDVVKDLYEHLIKESFDRNDVLIALGGGVVGDLTGFAAATYLRGIDFIQIPTTLLSQVDSSIGGKTGVDFNFYKNMVGAFHQPKLVFINIATLNTLPDSQFLSGMGEVLKHGLIKDAAYYEWTITHMAEIQEKKSKVLEKLIYLSCKIKKEVVEKDAFEKGERALLNFGHTIGHAIEKSKEGELFHGECVALGSIAAAHISWKRGYITTEEFYEIRDMNVGFYLPITVAGINTEEIIKLTKSDKKMDGGQTRFILLKTLGDAFIDTTVTDEEIKKAIDLINADLMEELNE